MYLPILLRLEAIGSQLLKEWKGLDMDFCRNVRAAERLLSAMIRSNPRGRMFCSLKRGSAARGRGLGNTRSQIQ